MQRGFLGWPAFISCKVVWDMGQKTESGCPITWVESGSLRTISIMGSSGTNRPSNRKDGWSALKYGLKGKTLPTSGTSYTSLESHDSFSTSYKKWNPDFPGGTMDRNPTANTGDTSSIPGPRISHMSQQLSPCATTAEACTPGSVLRKRSHCNEQPTRPSKESFFVPACHNQRKPTPSNEDPAQPKIK